MVFGYFTLFVALIISAVAEFYSIVGLTAIFSAAFWPIVIMGASLGVGKITAAVWLKLNWERASWTYKLYLVPAVAFLMVLTSMGIFGFLSKAHSDQSLVSGDSVAKVAIYDEKIKIERENIDANRKALKQFDEAVDQVMGRSTDEKGADKAVAIRRSQQKERVRLQSEIAESQKRITVLNEERAPLAAEFRKVEAEVGPIKYIAALVYGDNPNANILEKAVQLVIILIVAVFDPLALVLILAAQQSLRWAREERDAPKEEEHWQQRTEEHWQQRTEELLDVFKDQTTDLAPEPVAEPVPEPEKSIFERYPYLTAGFAHFKNIQPLVHKTESQETAEVNIPEAESVDFGEEGSPAEQEARRIWKAANPNDTLKHQRWLFENGHIQELPWMQYLEPAVDSAKRLAESGFGTQFPNEPKKGDTFVRIDSMPNLLYKFNGSDWIAVDKNLSDSYTYDSAYIDHLIAKIESGEYDPDLLSEGEREQVAVRLQGLK